MSNQYVLLTSGGSPITNLHIQQWLDLKDDASGSNTNNNQGAMYDHEPAKLLHRRRRSSALVNTSAYLHTPGAPATDGSTTDTASITNNNNNNNNDTNKMKTRAASSYANIISPFPDLASLQKEGLRLALARGADDAYVRSRLGANAAGLSGWVEWERRKEAYEICKGGKMKKRKMMNKTAQGVRGRKMPPLTSADVDGEAAVGFVAVVGREFNRDPGGWALQTMADSEILLAGGAKRVGTLLREQKLKDEKTLRQAMGTLGVVAKECEMDRQAVEEAGRVLTTLKMRKSGEEKREGVKMYGPLKKGDARLWQH